MIDRETLDRTLEKLLVAGVVDMDITGDVRLAEPSPPPDTKTTTNPKTKTTNPGAPHLDSEMWVSTNPSGNPSGNPPRWQAAYESQISVRRAQIDRMIAFAESTSCRMAALVHHFGDTTDTAPTCGLCDICNPSGQGSANAAHQPSEQEKKWLRQILAALESRSTSTGKLFTDLKLTKDRNDFDTLLDALARAGLITLTNDTFRNPEGKDITYKKASITHEGHLSGDQAADDATLDTVYIRGSLAADPSKKKSNPKSPGGPSVKASSSRVGNENSQPLPDAAEALFNHLRSWRTETARPTKTPAFLILSDAVLRAIAHRAPQNLSTLNTISGIGPSKVDKYGAALIALCRGTSTSVTPPNAEPNSPAPAPPDPPAPAQPNSPAPAQPNSPAPAQPNSPAPAQPNSPAPAQPQEGRRPDLYQPRAKPEETSRRESQRAGGPTYTPAASVAGQPKPAPQTSAVHQNKRPGPPPPPPPLTPTQLALEDRLKLWRRDEARTAGLPSFFILSDTILRNIVLAAPTAPSDLRTIPGLTPEKLDRFGPTILTLLKETTHATMV
jgi:ATP-dependent DNA helicase RecQ